MPKVAQQPEKKTKTTTTRTEKEIPKLPRVHFVRRQHRRFHGRGRHLGSGANTAKFTVNVWEKS